MTILLLLIIALCVILSGFFSGSESGFYFVNKEKLSILRAQGDKKSSILLEYLKHPGEIISMTLIGNTIVLQVATYCMMLILVDRSWDHPIITAEVMTVLCLFFPFFLFGEVFPKATYRLYAQEILLKTFPLLRFFRIIFFPLTYAVLKLIKILQSFSETEADESRFDRHHIAMNVGHAYAGGVLSEDQLDTLTQALNVGGSNVEKLMIPITRGQKISVHSNLGELYQLYKSSGNEVYPAYNKSLTDIVGTVDIRDMVLRKASLHDGLKDSVKQPFFVNKGEPFSHVFKYFFEDHVPLVFIKQKDKIIGYIIWEDALLKLLR